MKLKQHITDTMKEWQMKIGYNYEKVCLYYPASSLYKYINSEKSDCLDVQKQKLNNYIENNLSVLGNVKTIWDSDGKRVCIEIPAEGSKYVNENIKEPELLVEFLKIINDKITVDNFNFIGPLSVIFSPPFSFVIYDYRIS